MMTLFLIAMVGTVLILGSVPVVLMALMVETCREREAQVRTVKSPRPEARPATIGFARAA